MVLTCTQAFVMASLTAALITLFKSKFLMYFFSGWSCHAFCCHYFPTFFILLIQLFNSAAQSDRFQTSYSSVANVKYFLFSN